MKETLADLEVLFFATEQAWQEWLAAHHEQSEAIWLKLAKKTSGITSVNYAQALDVALCYGWIDGQLKTYDEAYYLQKFSQRRARSIWSKRNVEKVAALTEAGKMQPPGLAAVAAAQADGRWAQAYDSSKNMVIPADFQAELDKNPKAKAHYLTLNRANTYAILWNLQTAKRPETRIARIQKFIAMLNDGQKLH